MARIRLRNDDLGYETNCFVCEPTNESGLRIPFFHDDERDVVTAELNLPGAFSGAPTMLHGGVVLAVLDEAMAWACIAIARRWAVTAETSTTFHRAVRVDVPHAVEAEVLERGDGELRCAGRVLDVKGNVRAESHATFTVLGEAQFLRAVGADDGEAMRSSARLEPDG